MSCLCGDTNCSSCGPAQGADPALERVCEFLDEILDAPESINAEWLSDHVATALGKNDALRGALEAEAAAWASANRRRVETVTRERQSL